MSKYLRSFLHHSIFLVRYSIFPYSPGVANV
jgi:hypothetical protein